mgnify:CR=1 FL=1
MILQQKNISAENKRPKIVRDFLIIFYIIGIAGLQFELTRALFHKLIPFTILLSFVVLMMFHKPWKPGFVVLSLFIALSGFFVEAIGVHTNLIFGDYSYGRNLGIKLWGTPLLIGVNWLMLTYIGYVLTKDLAVPLILRIIAGAIMLVLYDLFMEPMAMKLDMWNWAGSNVPLQNYFAWFVISVLFISLFYIFRIKAVNKLALTIFLIQIGFFIVLNIFAMV